MVLNTKKPPTGALMAFRMNIVSKKPSSAVRNLVNCAKRHTAGMQAINHASLGTNERIHFLTLHPFGNLHRLSQPV
ncbi:MAG: hypothetical protein DMF74_26205 [Acidobacteria bacterium]|nr:MAG: hypothetical protein DMF74_26205 [Acidobacteriota bacterium]